MTLQIAEYFHCPKCRGPLNSVGGAVGCSRCGRSYPIKDGVVCLLDGDVRTDYALAPRFSGINRRAAEIGWRSAILERDASRDRQDEADNANEYVISEARADFRYLLPVDSRSTVLDIGSGWGSITTAFARQADSVIAVDTNLDNLQFVTIRAQQEGLDNVVALQADAHSLPVRECTCDVALMVGVLEWVAGGHATGSPFDLQKRALQRVHSALRPGGCLYLAIENRFSFKYWVGFKEPHTGLRFVSLLPYGLADRYSLLSRGSGYREITYSYPGLRTLLQSVGFGEVRFYFPVPGYQNFRMLLNLEQRRTTFFALGRLRAHPRYKAVYRLAARATHLLPLAPVRLLWPSFCVVATRA